MVSSYQSRTSSGQQQQQQRHHHHQHDDANQVLQSEQYHKHQQVSRGDSQYQTSSDSYSSSCLSSHRFTQRNDPLQAAHSGKKRFEGGATKAWITVPVPDADGKVQFRPRGFNEDNAASLGSTAWDVKSRYMMAMRSGPTECPDHLMVKHKGFAQDLETFPSPFALYYFDETAPNNVLLSNDLKLKKASKKPDNQRIPTESKAKDGQRVSKKEAMSYEVRKMFFDVDDIRIPEEGTGLKLLPSYSVSYKNYPAICYDVIAPENYANFFRIRRRPGMFA